MEMFKKLSDMRMDTEIRSMKKALFNLKNNGPNPKFNEDDARLNPCLDHELKTCADMLGPDARIPMDLTYLCRWIKEGLRGLGAPTGDSWADLPWTNCGPVYPPPPGYKC